MALRHGGSLWPSRSRPHSTSLPPQEGEEENNKAAPGEASNSKGKRGPCGTAGPPLPPGRPPPSPRQNQKIGILAQGLCLPSDFCPGHGEEPFCRDGVQVPLQPSPKVCGQTRLACWWLQSLLPGGAEPPADGPVFSVWRNPSTASCGAGRTKPWGRASLSQEASWVSPQEGITSRRAVEALGKPEPPVISR